MGICNSLGLPVQPSTFLDHLQTSAIRAGTYGAASMALLHTKPSEAGFQFVTGTFDSTLGGWGANHLGGWRIDRTFTDFEHKLAHGFLGAATGAVFNFNHPLRGMVAGAIGGAVSETVAEGTQDLFGHPWAGNAGILSGPLLALLTDQNVDVASATASNAIVNNFYAVHPSLYAEVDQAQVEQGQATREALEVAVSAEWPFLVGIKEVLGRQFGDLFTETNQMLHGSPNLSRLERTGLYYRQALALENMAHTNLLPTTYFGAALEGAALVPMGALRQGAVKLPQIIRQGGRFLRLERQVGRAGAQIIHVRPIESPHYTTLFRAQLKKNIHFPGKTDKIHFQEANKQLYELMQRDIGASNIFNQLYPGLMDAIAPGSRGIFPSRPPTQLGLTWHHNAYSEGVLDLVLREHHIAPGPVQSNLHPLQKGGMEIWGGGRNK